MAFFWGWILFTQAQNYYPVIEKEGSHYYEVKIQTGMTLFSISQDFNVSSAIIKQDNPGLTDQINLDAVVLVRAKRENFNYTVFKGDTPFGIAKKYFLSLDSLKKYNPGIESGLKINQSLKIVQGIKGRIIPVPMTESNVIAEPNRDSASRLFRTFEIGDSVINYTVRSGEKLADIAKRYLMTYSDLKEYNDLKSATLKEGMILKIPLKRQNEEVRFHDIPVNQSSTYQIRPIFNPVPFKTSPTTKSLRIGVFLPFNRDSLSFPLKGFQRVAFDFYMGTMVALDSLKSRGIKGDVYFFDYSSVEERMEKLIASGKLDHFDLFIGPLHSNACEQLNAFSVQRKIPLVLPFPTFTQAMESNPLLFMVASEIKLQVKELAHHLAQNSTTEPLLFYRTGLPADTMLESLFKREFLQFAPKELKIIEVNDSQLTAFGNSSIKTRLVCLTLDKKRLSVVIGLCKGASNLETYGLREWTDWKEVNSVLQNEFQFNFYSTTSFDLENPRTQHFHKAFRIRYQSDLTKSVLLGYDIFNGFIPWYFGYSLDDYKGIMTHFKYFESTKYHSNVAWIPSQFKTFKNIKNADW